ncbi:MAG: tape measure protein [Chlorobium sp.]|nr:tape measure protein [Chlorobium sp.]
MAASNNKIEIILTAIDQSVTKTFGQVNKAIAASEAGAGKYGRAMDALKAPINAITGSLARLGATLGAGFAVNKYIQTAEAMTNVNARLKLVTGSSEELALVQGDLYAMSQKTGTSYQANADTYQKLAIGLRAAGATSKELIGINEAVSKSLVVNGSSAEMTSSFLLQFGQAMGSGVLQGDEFRAMMESNSFFAGALAKALGTDIAGLRNMSKEGKLTTDVIRQAVPAMTEEIDAAFAKMPLTIGRATTMLANAFGMLVNGSNTTSGATGKIAKAIKDFVTYLEQNGKAIEDWAVKITTMAGELIKTAWEWKKFIAGFAISAIAVSAMASLTTAISGINAALMLMTGGAGIVAILANPMTLAIAAVGILTYDLIKLTTQYRENQQALRDLGQAQADAKAQKDWIDPQIAAKLAEVNKSLGTNYKSMKQLFQAEKEGKIHFDDLTGTWKTGSAAMASATVASSSTIKKVQGEALDAMKKKYQEYATEVKRLSDEIRNRQLSLYEQLRNMSRTGMSEVSAWQDLKRQAQEYETVAKAAAEAGDFKTAVEYADKAKEYYAQLNSEVTEGDRVLVSQAQALKTSMEGVQRAGEISINALEQTQKAAAAAMDDLVKKSGFQDLTEGMDDAEKQWIDNWQKMKSEALKDLSAVEDKIVALTKDREVTIYINEKVRKAVGGIIQKFARGGKLAGYGGGDRISALLEAGEFIIRKEAVAKFGSGIFHQLNSLQAPAHFATGGPVGAMGGGSGETVNINLSLPGGSAPVRMSADRTNAAELMRQLQRMQRLAS